MEAQPDISHLKLTEEYPRYKGIHDVKLEEGEKQMLMVRDKNVQK